MAANKVVKRNISGMQVIKTLLSLLEGNYTMQELIEKLNKNEKEPIFNNSVVSKYINTCRYCGIEIPKIHNRYFVAKLPFGLNLSERDLDLLAKFQTAANQNFASKNLKVFNSFITRLNSFSNKDIIKIDKKTFELAFEHFESAIQEKRRVRLMFKTKSILDCEPIALIDHKGKKCFKVFDKKQEKMIPIDRISGIEILGKIFQAEEQIGQTVVFKLTGNLATRYTLRDHETVYSQDLPETITISNVGEDKDELLARLLRYDKCCELLTPQEYREEMKLTIKKMLANYGEL